MLRRNWGALDLHERSGQRQASRVILNSVHVSGVGSGSHESGAAENCGTPFKEERY
jgi:hypothetical protein